MSDGIESLMRVGPEFIAEFRAAFRNAGPRHRNVDRWTYELGWDIDRAAMNAYLAPERPHTTIVKEGA